MSIVALHPQVFRVQHRARDRRECDTAVQSCMNHSDLADQACVGMRVILPSLAGCRSMANAASGYLSLWCHAIRMCQWNKHSHSNRVSCLVGCWHIPIVFGRRSEFTRTFWRCGERQTSHSSQFTSRRWRAGRAASNHMALPN